MRLPNGFGSVYKLSGNRRPPFVVKKTIAGKQRPLGYFSTHDEALMSQLYQFAIKCEMATTDYSRYVEIDRNRVVYKKRPFTAREINRLWKQADDDAVQDVLILIYTGLRIGEYLALRPQDIKIRERYIDIRHSKTQAGVRKVPISQRLLPFLTARKRRREICPTKPPIPIHLQQAQWEAMLPMKIECRM